MAGNISSTFGNEQQFNAMSDHHAKLRSVPDVPTFKIGDFIETLPNNNSIDTSDYSSQPDNQQKCSFFSASSTSNASINATNATYIVPVCSTLPSASSSPKSGPTHYSHQRYKPYYNRSFSNTSSSSYGQQPQVLMHPPGFNITGDSGISSLSIDTDPSSNSSSLNSSAGSGANVDTTVTLQISNIDASIDDRALKNYLISKLKPITPILSFVYEGLTVAKIRIPSQHHAKQVVAYLHRKKIGHKRIIVSYTRDSSTMEPSTLRCQVAGLLKDIPFYKLSMYKFRELFQSRFKTSISVMDLYDMKDICTISENTNDEKFISLRPELISSIESSELLGCLQLSVPYCTIHFKSGHRGWAELEIEPLPNVYMTIPEVRLIVYTLLKNHKGDIPVASIVYCIESELNVTIERNEKGVNLEHLIGCVNGVHITTNKFGIKILSWLAADTVISKSSSSSTGGSPIDDSLSYLSQPSISSVSNSRYTKCASLTDPFAQISREVIELVKLSPKSTMKFSRFIPAYHNHFGKQCRVADYGYTKLIELFEALTAVVQIMGDGENRQITLTHKCQIKCFTSDLMRILRSQSCKWLRLSHLPVLLSSNHAREFDITDYGVCDIEDIMDSLVRNNIISLDKERDDIVISIPKRRQSNIELLKTCIFAGEVVELLRNASQYMIPFEKFACSYHYHYGYQCRLSDYGYLKLADLMEAITGVVEIEVCGDEDRKVFLSPKIAQRVFSEQLRDLTKQLTGASVTPMNLVALLFYHKKQFGYQIMPQSLGLGTLWYAVKELPFIELQPTANNEDYLIICHHEDPKFVFNSYAACRVILEKGGQNMLIGDFINAFFARFTQILNEHTIETMNHAIEIYLEYGVKYVRISKMMIYVLQMIGVMERMSVMTVNELKTVLNVGISDCFSFGYPNVSTLIQALPDVFLSSSVTINDMSEITINKQNILVKNGVQEYLQGIADGSALELIKSQAQALMSSHQQQQLHLHKQKKRQILLQQQQQQQQQQQYQQQQLLQSQQNKQPYSVVMPRVTDYTNDISYGYGTTGNDGLHHFREFKPIKQAIVPPTPPIQLQMQVTLQQQLYQQIQQHLVQHQQFLQRQQPQQTPKTQLVDSHQQFDVKDTLIFDDILDVESTLGNRPDHELDRFLLNLMNSPPSIEGISRPRLYERKPSAEFLASSGEGHDGESSTDGSPCSSGTSDGRDNIDGNAIASAASAQHKSYFEPPKPDTPPGNVPYWMDPVWSSNERRTSVSSPVTESVRPTRNSCS